MGEAVGLFIIVAVIFAGILFVLWLAVPFILMATNRRLDKIIEILKQQKVETPNVK